MQSASGSRPRHFLAIGLVSLAGLLLEVGYTRIVSYKLWYYYTYLVIGLALLGIGSGGVLVAIWPRLKRASTDRIIAACSLAGAASIALGYLVIARIPISTVLIWRYGTASSFKHLGALGVISFVLFATFIAIGIIVATLLGRARHEVGRLYFADLAGAGLGCFLAVPLIARLGPPAVTFLAALVLALVGLLWLPRRLGAPTAAAGLLVLVLAAPVVDDDLLPDVKPELSKTGGEGFDFSEWGPVFRVDVAELMPDAALLLHDGTFGSRIDRFDGDVESLTRYDSDPRAIPFGVLGDPPERELIIGSAGGNEILASLYFGAPRIEAVELNPVTVSLLTDNDRYAAYTGHLPDRPEVDLHRGDGRSYLTRRDASYDLIWYVAPDSYAANNAASSGSFVLSESYLYTAEMITESLEHLTDDGIAVVQFGELDFERYPNRTARYVVTARAALEEIGVDDPTRHVLAAAYLTEDTGDLSTIVLKRTPFTSAEIDAFAESVESLPRVVPVYAPGRETNGSVVADLAGAGDAQLDALVEGFPTDISAVTDDAPFFWHFAQFDDVIAELFEPIEDVDPEYAIGERVLLLLLGFAVVYAAVFLLLPFFATRRTWVVLPAKGVSAAYFAALGLGFMFFEITMIQRLVRFLGYPTYSLTVTLASILVFTGLGALASRRLAERSRHFVAPLLALLALLTVFYQFALDDLTDALLSSGLPVRMLAAVVVLAPLGLCLGMFMPLGLGLVVRLTEHGEEYVAWSWAVNGFFSVIGSVLTTILSMSFGFRAVQYLALGVYALAAVALTRLRTLADRTIAPPSGSTAQGDNVAMASGMSISPAASSSPTTATTRAAPSTASSAPDSP